MSQTREALRKIKRTRNAAVGSQARDKQEPSFQTARPISDRHSFREILHKITQRFERLRFELRRVDGRIDPLDEEQTIASGVVTLNPSSSPRMRVVTVDTEADAATDDVDTIDGSNVDDFVIVKSADSSHDVRLTNAGNLKLGAFGAFTLLTTDDRATFHSDGTNLYAVSLRNN